MLFHTWIFLVFFLVVYPTYFLVRETRYGALWLLMASYVFYAWWNPLFLGLVIYSTVLDFYVVRWMDTPRAHRKTCLAVSVVNNLALLGFFKYANFVTDNLNGFLELAGVPYAVPAPDVLLPVGISFYTFQSMSYTIDFYRGKIPRESSFVRFAAFVTFFPQLVAGPIERAKNLLPQFRDLPKVTREDIADGCSLFVVGLFKKVALADYLALYVDRIYAVPDAHQAPALILATFAFGWQIYFDFSGYTDMARGLGRLLGFRLMLNFNNPYLATDLGDFWQRWHISLSSWFKDYVYVPLGGNRHGTVTMYRNVFITMVVSGLWHGAGWTFIIWGALHATGRMLTIPLDRTVFYREKVPRFAKQILVFSFVTLTWVFFRAESVGDAWLILTRIATSGVSDPQFPLLALLLIAALWIYAFMHESRLNRFLRLAPVRIGLTVAMLLYIAFFAHSGEQAFIYFQF